MGLQGIRLRRRLASIRDSSHAGVDVVLSRFVTFGLFRENRISAEIEFRRAVMGRRNCGWADKEGARIDQSASLSARVSQLGWLSGRHVCVPEYFAANALLSLLAAATLGGEALESAGLSSRACIGRRARAWVPRFQRDSGLPP